MKELKKKISALVWNYFDEKLEGFNFWEDPLEDKIEDMIDSVVEDMTNILEETDRDIDWELQEFNEQQAKRDWAATKRAEIRRNLELDRSLGLL